MYTIYLFLQWRNKTIERNSRICKSRSVRFRGRNERASKSWSLQTNQQYCGKMAESEVRNKLHYEGRQNYKARYRPNSNTGVSKQEKRNAKIETYEYARCEI